MKSPEEFGEDIDKAFILFAESMRPILEAVSVILVNIVVALSKVLQSFYLDSPAPGEHPVDWVLRVGPKRSGHNITSGEAWRYRDNLNWWNEGHKHD
jgi:hypothetical protein